MRASGRQRAGFALLLMLVLLAPALSGCVSFQKDVRLIVVGSAPKQTNGLTISAFSQVPIIGGIANGLATYAISKDGHSVYPPAGGSAILNIEAGRGTVFIPYSSFVVDNGPYDLVVEFNGDRGAAKVDIEKWVNYVFTKPYLSKNALMVDAVLEKNRGDPNSRILAEGTLLLDINYHRTGCKDTAERVYSLSVTTPSGGRDPTFTRVSVPFSALKSTSGYYTAESTFHNLEAYGNNNVKNDPTVYEGSFPPNCVFVQR